MKEYSEMFDWYYDLESTVQIVNKKQHDLYVKHHAKIVDVYWSDGIVVTVFTKESTRDLYTKWKDHTLE